MMGYMWVTMETMPPLEGMDQCGYAKGATRTGFDGAYLYSLSGRSNLLEPSSCKHY